MAPARRHRLDRAGRHPRTGGPRHGGRIRGWNDAGDAASAAVAHLDQVWGGEVFAAWTRRTTTTSR
ncbi:hypothetical protein ACU686_00600 [Yinghuangia aomiensis]